MRTSIPKWPISLLSGIAANRYGLTLNLQFCRSKFNYSILDPEQSVAQAKQPIFKGISES
jgi:hypothetical protein